MNTGEYRFLQKRTKGTKKGGRRKARGAQVYTAASTSARHSESERGTSRPAAGLDETRPQDFSTSPVTAAAAAGQDVPRSDSTRARPFIRLSNATFRLGERLVFENTNWTIAAGEHWAIVGANGSGKSLLGDALRGRLPLAGGELEYGFRPAQGLTHEQCIGHVSFEERRPHGDDWVVQSRWSAAEREQAPDVKDYLCYERVMEINPFEVGVPRGRRAFYQRQRRAVELLGIPELLERKIISLSNGERQKVELARALSLPLRVLIVDEPFTGLDVASRQNLRKIFSVLMKEGITIIFITANSEELPSKVRWQARITHCQVTGLARIARKAKIGVSFGAEQTDRRKAVAAASHSAPGTRPAVGEVLVEMRGVSVRYAKRAILKDLTWLVRAGESWAVLGPNGSGKTTLLSLITGDNPQAYSNHVVVFGRQRGTGDSLWDIKRHIGFLSPELHAAFPQELSCFQVVASGFHDTVGLFKPVTRAQMKAVKSVLHRFDLARQADLPLYALSTGLQRMVLLARALVKAPKLLILDEPCQGLDEEHRDVFLELLSQALASGRETALYVTHQPNEIPAEIRNVLRLGK